jgi:7-carboxy-7-deazaguanine synthase
MLGKNVITKMQKGREDGGLLVHEMFYSIQGEGLFAGHPAVFVRLSGCNLQCGFCDTLFDGGDLMMPQEIFSFVESEGFPKLCVITGGEPMLQDFSMLASLLIKNGLTVQIETNGMVYRDIPEEVVVVCSPKFNPIHGFALDPRMTKRVNAFKFIVSDEFEGYGSVPAEFDRIGVPIYVQPMDELDEAKNVKNAKKALSISLEKGYRLSLQLHKMLNIR